MDLTGMSKETLRILNEAAETHGLFAKREAAVRSETAIITARETARRLQDLDLSVDEIAFATNLTVQEVKELTHQE